MANGVLSPYEGPLRNKGARREYWTRRNNVTRYQPYMYSIDIQLHSYVYRVNCCALNLTANVVQAPGLLHNENNSGVQYLQIPNGIVPLGIKRPKRNNDGYPPSPDTVKLFVMKVSVSFSCGLHNAI